MNALNIPYSQISQFVGQSITPSLWLEITQERVNDFAKATNDFQWIHTDIERANKCLGGTIVHGFLTLSLIPYFTEQNIEFTGISRALNYGIEKSRFPQFVKTGARLRGISKIIDVKDYGGGKQIWLETTIEIENETKPACVATTIALLFE